MSLVLLLIAPFRDPSYLDGAVEYLKASQRFCLLMNRLCKKSRGHPYSADGNPQDGQTPFSLRLDALERLRKEQKSKEPAKRFRSLS